MLTVVPSYAAWGSRFTATYLHFLCFAGLKGNTNLELLSRLCLPLFLPRSATAVVFLCSTLYFAAIFVSVPFLLTPYVCSSSSQI